MTKTSTRGCASTEATVTATEDTVSGVDTGTDADAGLDISIDSHTDRTEPAEIVIGTETNKNTIVDLEDIRLLTIEG